MSENAGMNNTLRKDLYDPFALDVRAGSNYMFSTALGSNFGVGAGAGVAIVDDYDPQSGCIHLSAVGGVNVSNFVSADGSSTAHMIYSPYFGGRGHWRIGGPFTVVYSPMIALPIVDGDNGTDVGFQFIPARGGISIDIGKVATFSVLAGGGIGGIKLDGESKFDVLGDVSAALDVFMF